MPDLQSNKERWLVVHKYALTDDELEVLTDNPVTEAKDWSKPIYKTIRDNIRQHYFTLQNGTCCYCRLPINEGTGSVEIEHIIDKNRRTDFTFEPKNLLVSCHKCNFNKSTSKVMHTCPELATYPNNSNDFMIIQGHFDDYFQHIEFLADSTYHALTDEGVFTINTCKLNRLGLAGQRERVLMYEDDDIVADVIDIRNAENPNQKIDELINKLKGIIDNN